MRILGLQGINTLRNNKKLHVYLQLGARLELTDAFCTIVVNTPKYLPVKIRSGRFLSANHYYMNFHHHFHFVS